MTDTIYMSKRLNFAPHAARNMHRRGITEAQVEAVIAAADRVWQSKTRKWAYEAQIDGEWITVIRRPNGTIHTAARGRGVGPERILWRS